MAEKEYIERDAVLCMIQANEKRITPIEENRDMFYHDSGWNGASVSMKVEMRKIPAADVVEVVRCKDCKNAYINSFSAQSGIAVCRFLANRSNGELAIVQQDDFCSYGERKEQK